MSLYDLQKHRVFGLVLAIVTNNKDPDKLARVKVKYHMLDQQVESDWCRVVSFYAGKDRGAYWIPEVDDEVVIAFEHGDVNFPYVLGSVWNGVDTPKDIAGDGSFYTDKDDRKVIHSRTGHKILMDDTAKAEKLVITDKTRKNVMTMDCPTKSIVVDCLEGDVTFNVPKGTYTINAKNLVFKIEENIRITSGKDSTWKATGMILTETEKTMTLTSKLQFHAESKSAGMSQKASAAWTGEAAQITQKATGLFVMKGSIIKLN